MNVISYNVSIHPAQFPTSRTTTLAAAAEWKKEMLVTQPRFWVLSLITESTDWGIGHPENATERTRSQLYIKVVQRENRNPDGAAKAAKGAA